MLVRSGDAVLAFDADLTIVSWNRTAEELTGISAEEAVGRRCWEVLGARDERGNLVCHAGCSTARLAREGWPVPCQALCIRAANGTRRVHVSTVAVHEDDRALFLHIVTPHRETECAAAPAGSLTVRQQEVLGLLADGVPAKVIAARLARSETTVRNHIRAVLVALDAHSQLEAIAKARRLGLIA
jgi:PAS domain S-box-containing protein